MPQRYLGCGSLHLWLTEGVPGGLGDLAIVEAEAYEEFHGV